MKLQELLPRFFCVTWIVMGHTVYHQEKQKVTGQYLLVPMSTEKSFCDASLSSDNFFKGGAFIVASI